MSLGTIIFTVVFCGLMIAVIYTSLVMSSRADECYNEDLDTEETCIHKETLKRIKSEPDTLTFFNTLINQANALKDWKEQYKLVKSERKALKKQQEEEEQPNVVVQGSEILYNKRGRACGVKIKVLDQGTVYMKRKGSHWEITDISKENNDEKVWEMVQSSLEKMAKKNPTTFIRMMRNRAYELPKFKSTTITESVTINQITRKIREIL